MKLIDTYTNFCFIAILVNTMLSVPNVKLPLYLVIVSLVSIGLYIVAKIVLMVFFLVFTFTKLTILEHP